MKTIILTYGTFDLFHIGHLNILTRLKELGDELVVGVTTDDFNQQRGKKTLTSFVDRIEIVRSLRCVNLTFPMSSGDQKVDDIRRYQVSILGMGNDWKGKLDHLRTYCQVIYLPRTEHVSSTELRKSCQAHADGPRYRECAPDTKT